MRKIEKQKIEVGLSFNSIQNSLSGRKTKHASNYRSMAARGGAKVLFEGRSWQPNPLLTTNNFESVCNTPADSRAVAVSIVRLYLSAQRGSTFALC